MATVEGRAGAKCRLSTRAWRAGRSESTPGTNEDVDTRSVARKNNCVRPRTIAALPSTTPTTTDDDVSEMSSSLKEHPRVKIADGCAIVDLTSCAANDLEQRLPAFWEKSVVQYQGKFVIEINVRPGFEQMVQKTLEMMMSKPTVEYDEGKLFVKLQGDHKSGAYDSVSSQFKEWAGEGCHTRSLVDQQPGRNSEVRHDIILFGRRPPEVEIHHSTSPPCLRFANVPGEVVYAEDGADVRHALDKFRKMLHRGRDVFFDANGAKKSFEAYMSTEQSTDLARMYPFVLMIIAFPRNGLTTQELRERLGATTTELRDMDASTARNKVARRSTGSITDARNAAAAAAEAAYDAWTHTPGYDAAAARNAAAKAAIALRKDYRLDSAYFERSIRRGAVADPPDDPFPLPENLPTNPRAELNAHLLIDVTPQVTRTTFTHPRHVAAPWIGLFRYDQPFNEGKYYRIVPGETLYVPVPGVVVGRDGDANGFGNAADGGYGHHIFPLRFDELLVEVYLL